MRTTSAALVGLLALNTSAGCATEVGTTNGDDCVSSYLPLATAATWDRLETALLAHADLGRVASVRIQDDEPEAGPADQEVVRVVDLLRPNGRRLVQADDWRTDDGGWSAGVWQQCID